jgi:hypothetical protein
LKFWGIEAVWQVLGGGRPASNDGILCLPLIRKSSLSKLLASFLPPWTSSGKLPVHSKNKQDQFILLPHKSFMKILNKPGFPHISIHKTMEKAV